MLLINQIVFCKVSYMKYYKGAGVSDVPQNGGSFVDENGYGHEEYNFIERALSGGWEDDSGSVPDGNYCLGFVETKTSNTSKRNQLHIERINGYASFAKELSVSGATVVWCATSNSNQTSVVGWYRNANVYRCYQEFADEQGNERIYNVLAKSSDCVLLPDGARNNHIWEIKSKKYTRTYGFGQSMLWYANEDTAKPFLQRLSDTINEYDGENWLHEFPKKLV